MNDSQFVNIFHQFKLYIEIESQKHFRPYFCKIWTTHHYFSQSKFYAIQYRKLPMMVLPQLYEKDTVLTAVFIQVKTLKGRKKANSCLKWLIEW